MQGMSDPIQQHLVSKGYQKNFANSDLRVSVFDCTTGHEVGRQPHPIKRNFIEDHFNTLRPDGGGDDFALEREYSMMESTTLSRIRQLTPRTTDSKLLASAIALSAMHLVRSHAYRDFQSDLIARLDDEHSQSVEHDSNLKAIFTRQHNRPPDSGELAALSHEVLQGRVRSNELFVNGSRHAFNSITTILSKLHVQVIDIGPTIKNGFAFGDVPVVHLNTNTLSFGFRDRLALGDADLVMTPLTRRTAAFFTSGPRHASQLRTVTTHAILRAVNTLTIDASLRTVACHPDDLDEIARTWRYREKHRHHPSIWPATK